MRKILLLVLVFTFVSNVSYSQGLGKIVDEQEIIRFPSNMLGVDIMFGEGGFGLGAFYRKKLSRTFTVFTDLSVSGTKDGEEVEYMTWWGEVIVPGKVNRILLVPMTVGLQYRLFANTLTDNLRPYVNFGVGPSLVFTMPFEKEFFSSVGHANTYVGVGGYIGFGANFGLSKSSLVGLNFRYYINHLFNGGVESLQYHTLNNMGGFYITLNVGTMY